MASNSNRDEKIEKMLQMYIHDYMIKKGMRDIAESFARATNLGNDRLATDEGHGFLLDWFCMYCDAYSSKRSAPSTSTNDPFTKIKQQLDRTFPKPGILNQQQPLTFCSLPGSSSYGGESFKAPSIAEIKQLLARSVPKPDMLNQQRPISSSYGEARSKAPVSHINTTLRIGNAENFAIPKPNLGYTSRSPHQVPGVGLGRPNPMNAGLLGVKRSCPPIAGPSNYGDEVGSSSMTMNRTPFTQANKVPRIAFFQQILANNEAALAEASNNSSSIVPPSNSLGGVAASNKRPRRSRIFQEIEDINLPMYSAASISDFDSKSLTKSNETKRNRSYSIKEHMDTHNEDIVGSSRTRGDDNFETTRTRGSNIEHINTCAKNGLEEIRTLRTSNGQIICCDFSSDGELLASVAHEKMVLLWNMNNFKFVSASQGHPITDVRFRRGSTIFATSSRKIVQLWNASNPNESLLKLTGHEEPVVSLDFNPRKIDLLCSADSRSEIRLWNINRRTSDNFITGATRQVRFQPGDGNLLAASSGNEISLFDVETKALAFSLKGHEKQVNTFCWDPSGKYIASVSDDEARVWSIASGGKSVHGIQSGGKKFGSCTFRPGYSQALVIGSYQTIELWNPCHRNKTEWVTAHSGVISGLCSSLQTGLIASTSDDMCLKIWK